MNFTKLSLITFAALIAIPTVYADQAPPTQGSLTLEEAINKAIGQSPDLDQTRAQADRAKWHRTESLSGFLPSLTVGGHWLFDERTPLFEANFGETQISSIGPASPILDGEVILKVPVFDGLRNVDRFNSASNQGKAAELQVDWGTYSLRQQVRLTYGSILEAKELAIVAGQDVKDLEDHRRLVEDQLHAGVTTKVDLLRVESQLSVAISEKTNADDEVKIRLRQLAQLMGEEDEERDVTGALPVPSDADMKAIDSAELGSRYDIDALGLQLEASSDTQRADSKWWLPSISLLGAYAAVTSQPLKFTSYAFGVSLSMNIFDGMTSYSRSKEALESERIADRQQTSTRLQAKTDFETYRRRYRYNLERYRARADDVSRATETVRLALAGFRAGTQTNTDVLDAEQDLFNARSNEIQAQYGALESLVRFELALGRNVAP
jgi:outer membrane protein TolC